MELCHTVDYCCSKTMANSKAGHCIVEGESGEWGPVCLQDISNQSKHWRFVVEEDCTAFQVLWWPHGSDKGWSQDDDGNVESFLWSDIRQPRIDMYLEFEACA